MIFTFDRATNVRTQQAVSKEKGKKTTSKVVQASSSKEEKKVEPEKPKSPEKKCCPICYEVLETAKFKPVVSLCGHVYCRSCAYVVSEKYKKCSICSKPMSYNKCIELYWF